MYVSKIFCGKVKLYKLLLFNYSIYINLQTFWPYKTAKNNNRLKRTRIHGKTFAFCAHDKIHNVRKAIKNGRKNIKTLKKYFKNFPNFL